MGGFALRVRKQLLRCMLVTAGLTSWVIINPAHAQVGSARYSSIVVDAGTGDVLEDVNADQPRHPASLAKMMTLYMTFEALRDRRITVETEVPVSAHAASMEPSKLGLVPGAHLTVQQAILALVTKSANDAAAALGELLGGSEDRFAQMMTLRARALGMSRTVFTNASGLPDPNEWTTARDLALLARRLISDFPSDYAYFSTPSFVWHRQVIFNHDNLLHSYPGADGMKTGYTEASGHNLVTSAMRGGVRLIGVVMGAATNGERDIHMAALLNHGFEAMDIPVEPRRTVTLASRVSFISTAHAAETVRPVHARVAHWSVQVGTFSSEAAAHAAAVAARRGADAGAIRVVPVRLHRRVLWRAEVIGLTASDAQDACAGHHKGRCAVRRPTQRQIASR